MPRLEAFFSGMVESCLAVHRAAFRDLQPKYLPNPDRGLHGFNLVAQHCPSPFGRIRFLGSRQPSKQRVVVGGLFWGRLPRVPVFDDLAVFRTEDVYAGEAPVIGTAPNQIVGYDEIVLGQYALNHDAYFGKLRDPLTIAT